MNSNLLNEQMLTFEDALKELEQILLRLENGNISLDSAIEFYNRGNFLQAYCSQKLNEAKLKIEKIVNENEKVIAVEEAVFD